MDNNPLVSIIIAVYNAEKYLEESLLSILNQTYTNIEIICVNDGSTDNSSDILFKYEEKILIIEQSNKGQCAASNVGLKYSKGDLIKFIDADDLINPEHIELQVNKLNGRIDALSSCEWGRFYGLNPLEAKFEPETVWKDLQSLDWIKSALLQKSDMMGGCLWLIPRQIIEKSGGWDESLSLNNDFEFSVRLLLNSKEVLFAKGAKIFYRSGIANSLSRKITHKALESAIKSNELGFSKIFEVENSKLTRLLCANRYQEWVYRVYPRHTDLINIIEIRIKELGGSSKKIEGGFFFLILKTFLGWKLTKKIQIFFYKLGYIPKKPN